MRFTEKELRERVTQIHPGEKYDAIPDRLRHHLVIHGYSDVRERFYRRLVKECYLHGERAYGIIASVALSAKDKQDPERYFAYAVTRRLREHGMLVDHVGGTF